MGFEVVGLPHYVIWHVYEPSAEDLQRMAEMEMEKQALDLDVEDVEISRSRWEEDRKVIEAVLEEHRKKLQPELAAQGGAEGPVARVGEEEVAGRSNELTGIGNERDTDKDSTSDRMH
jgi:mannan polymerase II complex ANP1 subunit